MTQNYDVIVVGGGIAGSAAALRAAQYHLRCAWIFGTKATAKRSRSQWVANIDNMIGIHDGIVKKKLLKVLRGAAHEASRKAVEEQHHLHISTRDIVANTRTRIEEGFGDWVDIIDEVGSDAEKTDEGFAVIAGEHRLRAGAVVLATGVMDRQPLIKRQKGEDVIDDPKWIYPFANRETVLYCIRCEGHLTSDSKVAVIGSGEAAAQLSMMLHERYGSGCAVLTNGEAPSFAERSQALLKAYGITVHGERITELGGKKGKLNLIQLEGGAEVEVQFALVSLGLYRVYNDLARALGVALQETSDPIEQRHVLIDHKAETNVPNVFAIGDMARRPDEGVMKQVYTSQEYAVRAVDAVDRRRRAAMRDKLLTG